MRRDGQGVDEQGVDGHGLDGHGSPALGYQSRSRWDEARLTVVVDGEVDLSTADHLYAAGAADGARELTLDLRRVAFFDSAAIRTVIRLADRYPAAFSVLPSAHVRRVLEFCGLGDEPWLNRA